MNASHRLRPAARIAVVALAGLAMIAPMRAFAQVFRSTVSVGGGPIVPISGRGGFQDPGSAYSLGLGVGDDFSTVGFALGYSSFGAGPFEGKGLSVTQFELRTDCTPRAPRALSPYLRAAAGAYGLDIDRSQDGGTTRRFGGSLGVGVRWAPQWHSAITLVASYYNMPASREPPSQWVTVSLEFLRWMD